MKYHSKYNKYFKSLVAIYFPIGILVSEYINISECVFFLSLITYATLTQFSLLNYLVYGCVIFIIALPYKIIKTLIAALLVAIPYTINRVNFKLNLTDLLKYSIKSVPILCLMLFRTKFYILAILAVLIFYLKKEDYRLFVFCSIILLLETAYILTVNPNNAYANTLAIYSYYFLIFGVIGAILQTFINNSNKTADKKINSG